MLREAMAKGIRVTSQPSVARYVEVSLELAVEVSKFHFKQHLQDSFVEAVSAACEGRNVRIDRVVDKPHGFRGGGMPSVLFLVGPLMFSRALSIMRTVNFLCM